MRPLLISRTRTVEFHGARTPWMAAAKIPLSKLYILSDFPRSQYGS